MQWPVGTWHGCIDDAQAKPLQTSRRCSSPHRLGSTTRLGPHGTVPLTFHRLRCPNVARSNLRAASPLSQSASLAAQPITWIVKRPIGLKLCPPGRGAGDEAIRKGVGKPRGLYQPPPFLSFPEPSPVLSVLHFYLFASLSHRIASHRTASHSFLYWSCRRLSQLAAASLLCWPVHPPQGLVDGLPDRHWHGYGRNAHCKNRGSGRPRASTTGETQRAQEGEDAGLQAPRGAQEGSGRRRG